MIHTIIGAMSLAGTTIVILYLLLYLLAKRYFPTKWRYQMLKTTLFFFLFPLAFFKNNIEAFVKFIKPSLKKNTSVEKIDYTNTIMRKGTDIFIPDEIKIRWGILVVVGAVAASIIAVQLYQYLKMKRALPILNKEQNGKVLAKVSDYKKKLNIKGNVKLVISDTAKIPGTLGVFRPIIYLPEKMVEEFEQDDLELIICHELLHIKHKDLLIKFVALLALTINWFNPASYFLFYEICKMSEVYCDSEVVSEKDDGVVKRYCNLLIDIAASEKYTFRNRWSSGLVNNDMKMIKGRIMEMKNKKKRLTIMSLCTTAMVLLAGTSTVFAYEAPQQFVSKDSKMNIKNIDESTEDEWLTFSTEESAEVKMAFGEFFVYPDGTLEEVKPVGESSERHTHNWISGEVNKHIGNGKGCILEVYAARKCSACGVVQSLYLKYSSNYPVCVH